MKLKYLLPTILVCSLAHAGSGSSGGGNSRVCFKSSEVVSEIIQNTIGTSTWSMGGYLQRLSDSIKSGNIMLTEIPGEYIDAIVSIEVLDYIVMKSRKDIDGNPVAFLTFNDDEPVSTILDNLLQRFSYSSKTTSLLKRGRGLIEYSTYASYSPAPQVQDVKRSSIYSIDKGDNCLFTTIAFQKGISTTRSIDLVELQIDSRLFGHSKHSKISKVALMLHEMIYASGINDFRLSERENIDATKSVHKVVSLILTKELPTLHEIDLILESYGFSDEIFSILKH